MNIIFFTINLLWTLYLFYGKKTPVGAYYFIWYDFVKD